jgi:hypothetical protein
MTKKSGLDSQERQEIVLFSIVTRQALEPNQPPMQWVMEAVSLEVKRMGCEADHSPPPSAKVNNGVAIPPLPHMSSWRGA